MGVRFDLLESWHVLQRPGSPGTQKFNGSGPADMQGNETYGRDEDWDGVYITRIILCTTEVDSLHMSSSLFIQVAVEYHDKNDTTPPTTQAGHHTHQTTTGVHKPVACHPKAASASTAPSSTPHV